MPGIMRLTKTQWRRGGNHLMVCSKIDQGLKSGSNQILWRLKAIYNNIEILTKPGQN